MKFRTRNAAGRLLARELTHYKSQRPLVLAIPWGGVPVGAEVASALDAPFDIAVVRKAVAQRPEVERRAFRFRGSAQQPDVRGRVVIVVDDGVATGLTALTTIAALREHGPARVVLAAPVIPAPIARALSASADELVCLVSPKERWAIGFWYGEFSPVTDNEALLCLRRARGEEDASAKTVATARRQPTGFEQRRPWLWATRESTLRRARLGPQMRSPAARASLPFRARQPL